MTTHFDTKILPRIGPPAFGGEVTEGKHLGRTIRWSRQGFECESNSKHVEDMAELCGLKQESKGAPTPITKATGKGRRDIDGTLGTTDAQTFRQAAATGLHLSINRPSLQLAMSVVMSGMCEPKVVLQLLQYVRHGIFCNMRERLGCSTTKQTRRHCMCTRTRIGQRTR